MTKPPKRPQGRPAFRPEARLVQRSIRLLPAQWAKIDAAGMGWLRGLINRAKPPAKGANDA